MKKITSIFLPAIVAGVTSLLASGIASADNIFVVNNGSNTVMEMSNGIISTFIATDLNSPTGIAINSAGDFFVANNGNNNGYIEEYSPSGVPIQEIATGLNNPRGIAFDSAGNLDVAVQGSQEVLQIPVGGGADSVLASGFSAINYVSYENGTLYVTDGGAGTLDTVSGGTVTPLVTGLSSPNGMTFDSNGNLFVVQHGSSTISEIPFGTTTVNPIIAQTSSQGPKAIAIDSLGDFYVTDNTDSTVTEYNSTGNLIATFSSLNFNGPCYIVDQQLAVPEPSTYALMLVGLGGLLYFRSRRKMVPLPL